MISIFIMAMPTLVLVLLKSNLDSLDKINRVGKTLLFVNGFNLVMLFFTPFDLEAWLIYLIFLNLFIGIQKEIAIEAKENFFEFMVENEGNFLFTPTVVDEERIEGVLTLPDYPDFVVSAKYVGTGTLEKNTKYKNVSTYLAVNGSGNIFRVYCSN